MTFANIGARMKEMHLYALFWMVVIIMAIALLTVLCAHEYTLIGL